MAETTPLLSHASRPPHDHPIFLRVCHSPWRSLRQRGLLLVRTMIAVYLTTALALGVYYECKLAHRNARLYPFYASTVSLFIQLIYYWITAVSRKSQPVMTTWLINTSQLWTFEHLMGSRSRLPPDEQAKGVFLAHVQAAFSIPTSTSDTSKMAFSMFYTAAVTFPFVITITSWLYLSPIDDSIQASSVVPRAMQYFSIASSSVFNSVIAFSEIVALSSVRKQKVQPSTTTTRSVVRLLIYIALGNPHFGDHCCMHCLLLVGLRWSLLHRSIRISSIFRSGASGVESVVRNVLQYDQPSSECVLGSAGFACAEGHHGLEGGV